MTYTTTQAATESRWNAELQNAMADLWLDARNPDENLAAAMKLALRRYGFALVRGIGAAGSGRDAVAPRLRQVGALLGAVVPQNYQGSLLEDIRDFSDTDAFDNRGYRSAGELSLHTDPPTLIVLHCLNPARSGGANTLVNIGAIHAEMAERHPDALACLYRGYRYWVPSETVPGAGKPSEWKRPVLMSLDGRTSCIYYRPYIEMAATAANEPLSDAEAKAFDLFDALANSAQFQIGFTLAAGEAVVLHNRAVMHARGEYEDWPDPLKRRHLLRLWIDAPDIRPAPPEHSVGDFFSK